MQANTSHSVGIYVRVSTQEQAKEGYSIPTQVKLLESFCISQGWNHSQVYSDAGLSAKDTNRPALQQLQADIVARKVDILLVYRLDRLTRSVRDLFDILQFLEENDCAFKSATENYDTTTAMGRMFIGLVGLLAQWERENLGERVSIVMKEKVLTKLEASGVQPYGYRIEGKKRVIQEEEKEVVLLIVELFQKLGSAAQVSKELNARGIGKTRNGKPWRHQTIRGILRNPSLCGDVSYAGEVIRDVFEPIITREEFEAVSRRLEKQKLIRLKAPKRGMFSGMLQCPHPDCDRVLVKQQDAYRCNVCPEQGRPFMRVSEARMLAAFKKFIAGYQVEEIPAQKNVKQKRDYAKEVGVLERRRGKLQQMYADDFMNYVEFQEQMKENSDRLSQLEREKEELGGDEVDAELVQQMMWQLSDNFEMLTREEQVDFLAIFVNKIEFIRELVKVDKNGDPKGYEYTVHNVIFNRA